MSKAYYQRVIKKAMDEISINEKEIVILKIRINTVEEKKKNADISSFYDRIIGKIYKKIEELKKENEYLREKIAYCEKEILKIDSECLMTVTS